MRFEKDRDIEILRNDLLNDDEYSSRYNTPVQNKTVERIALLFSAQLENIECQLRRIADELDRSNSKPVWRSKT